MLQVLHHKEHKVQQEPKVRKEDNQDQDLKVHKVQMVQKVHLDLPISDLRKIFVKLRLHLVKFKK